MVGAPAGAGAGRRAVMTMISYAQNREDVLLDRLFPRGLPGFYIDVGANEPVTASVTKHFYDLGWHGINIEPALGPFERLCAARPRDVNLNIAASDAEGELTFFDLPEGYSTFSETNALRHRAAGMPGTERMVPTQTLARICEHHVPGTVDFLSIDVEGHEREVLLGADWDRWRPRVVVVEATEPATSEALNDTPRTMVPTHDLWESILLEANYVFAAYDGLNRFYLRSEDSGLAAALAVPANVADGYVPYEYHRQIQELQKAHAEIMRRHAADKAINQQLAAQCHGFSQEIKTLRANLERLERALTAARGAAEEIRIQAQTQAFPPPPSGVIEGVGPASLGVARRLTALSSKYPKSAATVKSALLRGRQWKRSSIDGQ
jgi:FkbM family methyltransferase